MNAKPFTKKWPLIFITTVIMLKINLNQIVYNSEKSNTIKYENMLISGTFLNKKIIFKMKQNFIHFIPVLY